MNYYVARNGQQYGPYTEETVRTYLSAGSLLHSDNIREETSAVWTTMAQLFPAAVGAVPAAQPYGAASQTPYVVPQQQPYYVPQGQPYGMAQTQVVPPNLHWALVLLLSFTYVFIFVWIFIQASWARKINPNSKATIAFVFWMLGSIASTVCALAVIGFATQGNADQLASAKMILNVLSVANAVCFLIGIYSIRSSMLHYYNTVEPINLQLSGVMTFFFSFLYLQYHMSRIARWKKTGILEA